MDTVRQEVCAAAVRVYDRYTNAGLQEKIPFFGVGMQYIRFAREEPELYRLLFLTRAQGQGWSAMQSMKHLQTLVRPTLMEIYQMCIRDRRSGTSAGTSGRTAACRAASAPHSSQSGASRPHARRPAPLSCWQRP